MLIIHDTTYKVNTDSLARVYDIDNIIDCYAGLGNVCRQNNLQ